MNSVGFLQMASIIVPFLRKSSCHGRMIVKKPIRYMSGKAGKRKAVSSVDPMSESAALEQLQALDAEISRHDALYYSLSSPVVSDETYDLMILKATEIEKDFPQFRGTVKKLGRVGYTPSAAFQQFPHSAPMLSLQNAFNENDIQAFVKRMTGKKENDVEIQDPLEFIVEPKIDGVSLSLLYRDGRLVRAGTRGDGVTGEEVTQGVHLYVEDIPSVISTDGVCDGSLVEVRGEVYMSKECLILCNDNAGTKNFSTARNAASGILRRKTVRSQNTDKKPLNFFAYSIMYPSSEDYKFEFKTQARALSALQQLGFKVAALGPAGEHNPGSADNFPLYSSYQSLYTACKWFEMNRHILPYEVDGLVIKLNDFDAQDHVGCSSKFPRWAIAYKFSTESRPTKLRGIDVQVGSKGALTPVALLDPVLIGGTWINRATLHNEDNVNKILGDELPEAIDYSCNLHIDVVVCKSGAVIPKVLGTVKGLHLQSIDSDSMNHGNYQVPRICPSCGSLAVRTEGEAVVSCTGDQFICPAQNLGALRSKLPTLIIYIKMDGC